MTDLTLSPTVSLIEAVWTLLAVVALPLAVRKEWRALEWQRELRRAGLNGARELTAAMNVRTAGTALVVLFVFAGIGVLAMLTPPRDGPGSQPDAIATASGLLLIAAEARIVWWIWRDWQDALRLRALLGRGRGGH